MVKSSRAGEKGIGTSIAPIRSASPSVAKPKVPCPVLIVRGALSPLLSAEGAAEWIDGIANASLVEIPGGGHNVHIECPDEVLAAVDAFVAPFR